MRSRMRRRIVAFAIAAVSALTIVGTTAATASALVRGHAAATMNFGRGGTFPQVTPPAVSTAAVIGGLAMSVALIALVAWMALRSDRQARAQLALAPGDTSTGEARRAGSEDQERKAA
jgi:hypothetical protein